MARQGAHSSPQTEPSSETCARGGHQREGLRTVRETIPFSVAHRPLYVCVQPRKPHHRRPPVRYDHPSSASRRGHVDVVDLPGSTARRPDRADPRRLSTCLEPRDLLDAVHGCPARHRPCRLPERMDGRSPLGAPEDAGLADSRDRSDDDQPVAPGVGELPPEPLVRRVGPGHKARRIDRRRTDAHVVRARSGLQPVQIRASCRGRLASRTRLAGRGLRLPGTSSMSRQGRRRDDGAWLERSMQRTRATQSNLERVLLDALRRRGLPEPEVQFPLQIRSGARFISTSHGRTSGWPSNPAPPGGMAATTHNGVTRSAIAPAPRSDG